MFFPFHDDNPTTRLPVVTVAIIVLNVICLFYMNALAAPPREGEHRLKEFIYRHGFLPARVGQLAEGKVLEVDMYPQQVIRGRGRLQIAKPMPPAGFKGTIRFEPDASEVFVSSLTAMFLHAGWFHLISNMWFFWLFGNNIEDRLGHITFLLFYLVGGLIATGVHWLMTPAAGAGVPVIGASGAVAVTLGAYAVFYPFARVRTLVFIIIFFTVIELPAIAVLGIWFVGQLLNGYQALSPAIGTNVAWWAHIGGFLAGAALMPILAAGTPEPGEDWDREAKDQFGIRRPRRER